MKGKLDQEFDEFILEEFKEKEIKKVDHPLNGIPHPKVIEHHRKMRELKANEINFTSKQLIALLEEPRNGHYMGSYLRGRNETNSSLNPQVSKPPKVINYICIQLRS